MMEKELFFICVNDSRSCPNLLVSDKSEENFPERCRKFGFLEPAIQDLLCLDLVWKSKTVDLLYLLCGCYFKQRNKEHDEK